MNSERKTGGFSFFAMWFGAAVSLAEIMTGSLIAPLGIKNGILMILLGHVAGCLILALVGVIGYREKKPSLVASRISLGRYGSYLVSIFNILQLIGWTAIMLIQCSRSIQEITRKLFGFDSFMVLTVVVGVLVAIWALNAEKGIHIFNNIAVVLLMGLSIAMLVVSVKGTPTVLQGEGISFGAALELSIIMPLSWVPLISDYTMRGKSGKGSFWGSFTGYFIGSSLMYIIGLVYSVNTGTSDPISSLASLNPAIAALAVVVLATVTTTFMDVFSAVFSTLNIAPKLGKSMLIIVYTALGTLLALFFPMEQYQNFLYILGSIFAPVFTVVLMDYFVFRNNRSESFANFEALICAAAGTTSYYLVAGADLVIGATIPAMLVTGFLYLMVGITKKYFKRRTQND